jgi:23S rRNA (adenine2503-C2)-methyltransferase
VTTSRYDLERAELEALLDGLPRYRVDQVWEGLYRHGTDLAELTTLPRDLRSTLAELLPAGLTAEAESRADRGQTVKWLWSLHDGARIETVLMHYRERSTVCVSTQAGCAMGCGFCATGQAGFERNLSTGEIVEQVMRARTASAQAGRRLQNVVFMGIGEPLANYERTWAAVQRLHAAVNIGARHLTISTVGVVPGIRRLAGEDLPVNLAVSLHAANDDTRSALLPINRRYPLRELVDACHAYLRAKHRRLTFEWAMIAGVNDRPSDTEELAALALPLRAHVNLIPLNPTPGYGTAGSDPSTVRAFRDQLQVRGVNATIRHNRGHSIDAACGQLRASTGK